MTSFQKAGALLSIDRGDGALSRLASSEAGAQISIEGSLDGYGRLLKFARYGAKQTPVQFSFLNSLRAVLLTGFLGVPGSVDSRALFYGTIRQSVFNVMPPVAQIECQDVSAQFSNVPFSYYLAPKTLTSRLEVLVDVINQYEIPCDLDSLDLGNNDGGYVYKGINEAGGFRLLDWIRDFLAPIGRHIYFRADGNMQVFRLDETAEAVATLTPGDIIRMSITPPAVNEVNAVTTSAFCFPWIGPSGQVRTITVTEDTSGSYTPVAATQKQDHTTGVVSGVSPAVSPQTLVKRVITTTTYYEGSITFQKIQEYGYYAPVACKDQQNAACAVSYNSSFDVYHFPDGTWRTVDSEQWLLLKETRITKTYGGASNQLSLVSTEKDYYTHIEMPTGARDGGGVETCVAGFLTSDGRSWWAGRELLAVDMPTTAYEPRTQPNSLTEKVETLYVTVDSDKQVTRYTDTVYLYGRYYWPNFTTVATNSRDIFGPSAAKRYAAKSDAGSTTWIQAFVRTFNVTTATAGATQYGYTLANGGTIFGSAADAIECMGAAASPNSGSYGSVGGYTCQMLGLIANGAVETFAPLPIAVAEYRSDQQTPQGLSVEVTDDVRIANSGDQYDEFLPFEFCETASELAVVAWENLRMKSAQVVEFETPMLNLDIEEGSVLSIPLSELMNDYKKVVVKDFQLSINGMSGEARNIIRALWFPPNLAVTVT